MFLSAMVTVKNNARTIRYVLESIKKHADEIVVIDSGATDATLDIAREYTDRIFFREWDNNFGNQKNFGISKCRGKWVFIMDADEFVGENFAQALPFLDNRYRMISLPRYHIINVPEMIYITTRPHYFNWQGRFIRNDGLSYHEGDPIHHPLKNYRPRLRCSLANIFHLDFVINDHTSRQKKVDYYESHYPGAGYPRMYLFEDYPYRTARTLEKPEAHVTALLQQDKDFFVSPENNSLLTDLKQKYQYHSRALLTKSRALFGI